MHGWKVASKNSPEATCTYIHTFLLGLMRMHTDPKSEAGLYHVCDFEDEMTRDRPPGV